MSLEKQAIIKSAIEKIKSGEMIEVINASGYIDGICIGDFRSVGWSKKYTDYTGMWYEWYGPTPIKVDNIIIYTNGSTPYCEMNWD